MTVHTIPALECGPELYTCSPSRRFKTVDQQLRLGSRYNVISTFFYNLSNISIAIRNPMPHLTAAFIFTENKLDNNSISV
jgi:hypothetical protein